MKFLERHVESFSYLCTFPNFRPSVTNSIERLPLLLNKYEEPVGADPTEVQVCTRFLVGPQGRNLGRHLVSQGLETLCVQFDSTGDFQGHVCLGDFPGATRMPFEEEHTTESVVRVLVE